MFYDEEIEMAMYEKMKENQEVLFITENSTIPDYYKNVLLEDYHAEFEQILKSVQHDLKLFHTNLVYTEKILNFINTEFITEGAFPQDLAFLHLFITNTVDAMILTTYKLVLDNANIKSKKNGGLSYLKSLINTKKLDDELTTKTIRNKLKEVRPLFKNYETLCNQGNIDVLRNSKIAHYDIGRQEEIKKVDWDTLLKIYNVSVDIFEILSLKHFERRSTFDYKMIEIHSFKNYVCQNVMLNNPNGSTQLDVDGYFSYLRRNFISSLSNKQSNQL